jgi:hypothetical protein
MVTLVVARETIYQRFVTAWGATSAFVFDNEDFAPPTDAPWVRMVVRHDGSSLECIGGNGAGGFNTYQRTGRAIVQVFGRLDKGTLEADSLAQAARAIFEGTTLSNNIIRFNNVVVREIGPDGSWYQINVEAFFQYDERK